VTKELVGEWLRFRCGRSCFLDNSFGRREASVVAYVAASGNGGGRKKLREIEVSSMLADRIQGVKLDMRDD